MKLLNLKPIPTLKEISKLIELKGIKRKYVARQLNMTPEYLSNILNGRVSPKNVGETLQRIKECLDGEVSGERMKIEKADVEFQAKKEAEL